VENWISYGPSFVPRVEPFVGIIRLRRGFRRFSVHRRQPYLISLRHAQKNGRGSSLLNVAMKNLNQTLGRPGFRRTGFQILAQYVKLDLAFHNFHQ